MSSVRFSGWMLIPFFLAGCGASGGPAPNVVFDQSGGAGSGNQTDGGPNASGGQTTINVDLAKCGNKAIDSGEQCDDGNKVAGDGCDVSCQIESGYRCPNVGEACVFVGVCGDGQLSSAEGCDDGNTASGDGCAGDCSAVEPGWVCHAPGRRCVPLCGDGVITQPENCDDGNTNNGDGCSSVCLVEPGWSCTGSGSSSSCTKSQCGNGKQEAGENCDNGTPPLVASGTNGLFYGDGSGCSKTCTREPNCRPSGTTQACTTSCGDGNIDPNEQCDDGNQANGDGCSSSCTTETGFTCTQQNNPDTQPCPSNQNLQCLVLPVIFRDFDGHNVSGGHPDFFFYGASSSSPVAHATGVSPGASVTTCVPNASGSKAAWSPGQACPNTDATGPCNGIAQSTLGSNGKPVLGKDSCPCVFTDWDRTGLLGTCPGSGACSPSSTLSGVQDCFVQGDSAGSHRLRIDTTVKVVQSADTFTQWYTDSTYSNKVLGTLELAATGGLYQFSSSTPGAPAGTSGSTVNDDIHKICLSTPLGQSRSGTLTSGFFPLENYAGKKGTVCNIWPYWLAGLASNCCAGASCPVKSQWDPVAAYDNCPQGGTGGPVPKSDGSNGQVTGILRNFYTTTEARYVFRYDGSAGSLSFFGDDDVWVFINGRLAIDLGAPHERIQQTVTLNAATYGLETGKIYEIAVFHADRHPRESNYQLTLPSFSTTRSVCTPHCGDGVVTTGEECDDGSANNDGRYGGCTADCKYGPFCGDNKVNGDEECDRGRDNGPVYRTDHTAGCTTGCKNAHYCGDGVTDVAFGEQCDGSSNCTDACKTNVQ
jgi:fibro-slime domain-containing protein